MPITKSLELGLKFASNVVFDGARGRLKHNRDYRRRLVEAGRCVRCRRQHSSRSTICSQCTEKRAELGRARRIQVRQEGKCVKCHEPWSGSTLRCVRCKQEAREKWAGKSVKRHCVRCAGPKDETYKICKKCRAKLRGEARIRRIELIKAGRCTGCGGARQGSILWCETCALKSQSRKWLGDYRRWSELKALLETQNHQCAYTGEVLVVGHNAAVDHKIPRSRGGSGEITNLQWVTYAVNASKWNLMHDEFLTICHSVAERNPKPEFPDLSMIPLVHRGRPRGSEISRAATE